MIDEGVRGFDGYVFPFHGASASSAVANPTRVLYRGSRLTLNGDLGIEV